MRSLSSIKDRLKDEQPQIHSQAEKGITSVRLDEISKDHVIKETKVLSQVRKRFNVDIKEKQKQVNQLADIITRNRQLASDEIEKVLKDARTKANTLISQAESTKNEADTLLSINAKKEKQLDELDQELVKRETDLSVKETSITQKQKDVIKKEEQAQKNILLTNTHYQEALGCYISAVSLLGLAIDHLGNLAKIRGQISGVIYQNLEKIGIIEKRAITLMKLIDGDKLLLKQKGTELKNQEVYLRDREKMLDRTAKELKQKNG